MAGRFEKNHDGSRILSQEEVDDAERKVQAIRLAESAGNRKRDLHNGDRAATFSSAPSSPETSHNSYSDSLPPEDFKRIDDDDDDDAADRDLSVSEKASLVTQFKKTAAAKGGDASGLSEGTVLRFLRACNLNVEKGATMWCNFEKWRASFAPLGYIPESQCLNELAQNKTYLQGWDKQGRALVVLQLAKHQTSKRSLDEVKRSTVYVVEKACANIKPGAEQFSVIVDLAGVGYKNLDLSGTYHVFYQLQSYYPERLGKIWLLHTPYIFHAFWKMVTPFLYKRTKRKIVFLQSKHSKKTLLEHIDEEYLPTVYGGKAALTPIQNAVVPGWPPVDVNGQ